MDVGVNPLSGILSDINSPLLSSLLIGFISKSSDLENTQASSPLRRVAWRVGNYPINSSNYAMNYKLSTPVLPGIFNSTTYP